MSELSEIRNGRFTSSNIYKIAKNYRPNGKNVLLAPALTYIEEIAIEKELGRSLDSGADSQPIRWGKFCEFYLFKLLGLQWSMTSKDTLVHPKEEFSKYWCGTPDLKSETICGEIKCYQLKHFVQIVKIFMKHDKGDLTTLEAIEILKEQEPEIYWQTVSNCILLGLNIGQMIVYAPTESEMINIREEISNYEGEDQFIYKFIVDKRNDELAVLPDNCKYNSINVFEFEVPKEDKELLENAMREAIKELKKLTDEETI